MKNYSKLFGLTKPERTTLPSARNAEIEENRKKVDGGTVMLTSSYRGWMNRVAIADFLRWRNVANSRRKRGEIK